MAIYRFKVSLEDDADIFREVDIRPNQSFEDLHDAIHRTTGCDPKRPSSFYVSNDYWHKKEEITLIPTLQKGKGKGKVASMNEAKLNQFIDDPHQKFYYIYNFERPYEFHIELVKILDQEKDKAYPYIHKCVGQIPSTTINQPSGASAPVDFSDDFDFTEAEEELAYPHHVDMEDLDPFNEGVQEDPDKMEDEFGDSNAFSEHEEDERFSREDNY